MKAIFSIFIILLFVSANSWANNPPAISGINCKEAKAQNFKTDACAGQKLCFTICTSDIDESDSVSLEGISSIIGSDITLINEGGQLESVQFCWTPTEAQARKDPYTFVVTAKDNSGASNNSVQQTFSIVVKENPSATIDTLTTGCGEARFTTKQTGNIAISQFMWNLSGRIVVRKGGVSDTIYHHYKYPGQEPFTLTLIGANGCNRIYSDSYKRHDYVEVKTTNNLTACAGSTVELSAKVSKAFGEFEVEWSNGEKFNRQAGNVSFTVADRDTYVIARVNDMHCYNADTTFITVNNPVSFDLGNGVKIKPGQEYTFKPNIYFDTLETDTVLTYNWYKDDLVNPVSTKPFLVAKETAIYYLEIGDSLYCKSIDSVALLVTTSVGSKLNESSMKVFPNPAHNFIVLQFEGQTGSLEIFDLNGKSVLTEKILDQQTVDISALAKGIYTLKLKTNAEVQTQVLIKD
jgi:hypothetical protein